jgi:acyl-coenzyme A synthetase/AMP-(fatty) acid ligase
LEEILRCHPALDDFVVVGIPHDRSGEVPKGSKLTADEVKNFVANRVSDHKHLADGLQFVPSIPKNASGKIL